MIALLTAFFTSFLTTFAIIKYQNSHIRFSNDDADKPQRFHTKLTPRIGGVAIMLGIFTSLFASQKTDFMYMMIFSAVPAFIAGLTEDITKIVSVRKRLFGIAIGSTMAFYFLNAKITYVEIIGIDDFLSISIFSLIFTVFAITGLSNAFNIIDGFNGLAGMVAILTLLAIMYLSIQMNDRLIAIECGIMIASLIGFFIWNYPKGLIFLGDGGAYLIGFWIAVLTILMIVRHPNISPWFAISVNSYPIFETIFTIYRRKIHQGKSPSKADAIHFHSLIYRRLLNGNKPNNIWAISANSRTAPYFWIFALLGIVPSILWWHNKYLLIITFTISGLAYIWIYKRIVSFRTPKWLFILK